MPHDLYMNLNQNIDIVSLNDVEQLWEWVGGIKKFFLFYHFR